jgi:hypothetical protein
VTVSVFFGAAGHEETVNPNDEGMRNWRSFTKMIRDRGFKKGANLSPGVRYSRRRANIDEIIDVVSPEDLHALNNDTDGVFTRALQEHEIKNYDYVEVYGASGQRVARYTGEMGGVTTAEIPGNRAEIRLTSDGSVTGHGFDLVAVEYR